MVDVNYIPESSPTEVSRNVMFSPHLEGLAEALSLCQKDLLAAPFNAENPYFKSQYADLGSVIEAAKLPLSRNNLSVSQLVGGGSGQVSLTTVLMHSSGQWIASTITFDIPAEGKNPVQAAGSIITYLRRYSYAAILGIYSGGDDDANSQTQIPQQVASQPPPPKPVSEKLLKKLWATCKDKGIPEADLRLIATEDYEVSSLRSLTDNQCLELIAKLEALPKREIVTKPTTTQKEEPTLEKLIDDVYGS